MLHHVHVNLMTRPDWRGAVRQSSFSTVAGVRFGAGRLSARQGNFLILLRADALPPAI